jgi:hypothetical protein
MQLPLGVTTMSPGLKNDATSVNAMCIVSAAPRKTSGLFSTCLEMVITEFLGRWAKVHFVTNTLPFDGRD